MRMLRQFPFLSFSLLLPATLALAAPSAPRFDGLGNTHRTVTTVSPEAQEYFDQGLVFYWGFNGEESARSFEQAAALDPDCAMAYWGAALAVGPNINNPSMDEDATASANRNIAAALARIDGASAEERDLIRALATRYADPAPEDRAGLDSAYAAAMRDVWANHPDDPDVAALFAESLMILRPWDLWSPEGEPRPETPEVMRTLEAAMKLRPDHPMANHLYIHTMEASPDPARALPEADRLRDLVPGIAHLVHMPSHIYIRLGRYDDAIAANQRAVEADKGYMAKGGGGAFHAMYSAHNYHFLAYAAMFAGRRDLAMSAAREMRAEIPMDLVRQIPDFLDGFLAVPYHVMVRFGLWQELLDEPAPPEDLPVTTAFWRCDRTVALAALGRVEEAEAELAALREAYDLVPESALIGNNTARVVLDIGMPFAEGELEYRRGNYDRAFELLRTAVARDVALKYDEPWGWMEPVRHALGALLLEQGHVKEAEEVYRADLQIHPDNGWALNGLAECQRKSGQTEEAAKTEARFRQAWARSDTPIKASCYCRTKS